MSSKVKMECGTQFLVNKLNQILLILELTWMLHALMICTANFPFLFYCVYNARLARLSQLDIQQRDLRNFQNVRGGVVQLILLKRDLYFLYGCRSREEISTFNRI